MPTFEIEVNGSRFQIDAPDERALGAAIQQLQANQQPAANDPPDTRDNFLGKVDAGVRGLADTLSFGLADEIAAHAKSGVFTTQKQTDDYYDRGIYAGSYNPLGMFARAINAPFASETKTADYEKALEEERAIDDSDSKNRFAQRLTGQILGGVAGGAAMAKAGLSPTAKAISSGKGLGAVTKASAIEGAVMGGAQGFGSGEGLEDRLYNAGLGTALGFGAGAALPAVTTAIGGAVKGVAAPFIAPFKPEGYSEKALAAYMRRSGKTPEQIADIMRGAADDGQGMYTIADAMGNAGQRALVPVTRTPNDARQEVKDFLIRRQLGQPQRLAGALAEGFDAPQTSDQFARALTSARDLEADALYGAARREAGAVNVTPVLEQIDQTLSPGVNRIVSPRDNIGNDTIEGALARFRRMISDGDSQVTDFNTLFRAKLDLDDMIARAEGQGAGNRAHYLGQVKREVDRALERASSIYRTANDRFAQQSRVLDTVAEGSAARSGRVRSDDAIEAFSAMTPEQQQAFRTGYVDPIIADIESKPMGPVTNRARSLTTPKYEQEFQAFAAPGRAEQLGQRIGRENRMFETANAALGNSKTADNFGDIEDLFNYDPTIMVNLLSGNMKQAALTGIRQAFNAGKGLPPRVVERVGRSLIETNPDAALNILGKAQRGQVSRDQLRALIVSSLLNSSGAGVGRATSP